MLHRDRARRCTARVYLTLRASPAQLCGPRDREAGPCRSVVLWFTNMAWRNRVWLLAVLVGMGAACRDQASSSGAGGTGGGTASSGMGGCPADKPRAAFELAISAETGALPQDLRLEVEWSAGVEPVFLLDDPSTYASLDSANVVCDVDATLPAPTELSVLRCDLWTPGVTKLRISALDYITYEESLMPQQIDDCAQLATKVVKVTLGREPLR